MHIKQLYFTLRPVTVIISCMMRTYTALHRTISLFHQVNLIMNTMGAMAFGTEAPSQNSLLRKPYKRSSSLISRPMIRNILTQSVFQLILLFILLFEGSKLFNVRPLGGTNCLTYHVKKGSNTWDALTLQQSPTGSLTCSSFKRYCPAKGDDCYRSQKTDDITRAKFKFSDLPDYSDSCLACFKTDYIHGTIIFNTFIFCQVMY